MTIEARSRVAVSTLVLACALASGTAWAASGRVSGQVTGPDGRPIAGVAVSAGSAAATTGPGGLYALEGVSTGGRVVVTFAKPGHATTHGVVEIPASDDTDGDGVPDDEDRCPASDLRPTVTIDGCDTGLGNRLVQGCTAMDVFLECAERVDPCGKHGHGKRGHGYGHGKAKSWHLLGCLAEPRFLRRVDGLTCRTLKQAISCVKKATLPLEELEEQPTPPSPEATLHRTLLPTGATLALDAAAGGTLRSAGSEVTFFPGSIAATGQVGAALTPLDVTGPAIGAFPGDFLAIDRSQKEVQLETSALLHVALAQGDTPVALKSAARVEMLLPLGAPYPAGSRVALWLFDPSDGFWREQPNALAIVQASSTTPGRQAAVGFVDRPGWWNVDRPVERTCLCGTVEDARRLPVEGALVTATGLDHYAVTSARSAADGSYCVEARTGSRLALRASAVVDGLRLDSAPAELTSPLAPALCAEGGCGAGPFLALPGVSCVEGMALDATGVPRGGVSVVTSAGSAAVTDATGRYHLGAPAEQAVTVFAEGYPPATAFVPGPGAGCAVLDLVPPAAQTACVSGRVVDLSGKPLPGATVQASEEKGGPLLESAQADGQGAWSLGRLPLATSLWLRAFVAGDCFVESPAVTGAEPGEPGTAACTPVPDLVCGGVL